MMTKDPEKRGKVTGASGALGTTSGAAARGPSEAQRAASRAFAAQFERLREESDELLKLQRTAERLFSTRHAADFEGLCQLLDAVLPRDGNGQRRVARALELDLGLLQGLRSSVLDPLDAPPAPITALSRAMRIDFPTFWVLAQRDHERLAAGGPRAAARSWMGGSSDAGTDTVLAAFRRAWERDERDDPSRGSESD